MKEVLHDPQLFISTFAAHERDRATVGRPVQVGGPHPGETRADLRNGAASDAYSPEPAVEREGQLLAVRRLGDLALREATDT